MLYKFSTTINIRKTSHFHDFPHIPDEMSSVHGILTHEDIVNDFLESDAHVGEAYVGLNVSMLTLLGVS